MIDEQTKKLVEIRWPARPYSPGMRTIILFVSYLLIMQLINFDYHLYSYFDLSQRAWYRQAMLFWNISFMSLLLTLWGLIMGRAYSRYLLSLWLSLQCLLILSCFFVRGIADKFDSLIYQSMLPRIGYGFIGGNTHWTLVFVFFVNVAALISIWRVLYPDLLKRRFKIWKQAIEKSRYWGVPID